MLIPILPQTQSMPANSIYLCTFAIPLSLLSYLYAGIGLKLWRRRMPGNVDVNRDLTMQVKRVKVSLLPSDPLPSGRAPKFHTDRMNPSTSTDRI